METDWPSSWPAEVDGHVDPDELAVCRELRTVFGVAWYQLLARRFPSRTAEARTVLAQWLP